MINAKVTLNFFEYTDTIRQIKKGHLFYVDGRNREVCFKTLKLNVHRIKRNIWKYYFKRYAEI